MSTFSYQAIDRQGQTIRGKLNAENKESVIVSLKQQGIYVTKLAEEKSLRTRLAPKESSILSILDSRRLITRKGGQRPG